MGRKLGQVPANLQSFVAEEAAGRVVVVAGAGNWCTPLELVPGVLVFDSES